MQYEAQKKSAWAAGVLEYAVPLAGYAYAGDWRRGLWPAGLWIAGGMLFVVPAITPGESARLMRTSLPWGLSPSSPVASGA